MLRRKTPLTMQQSIEEVVPCAQGASATLPADNWDCLGMDVPFGSLAGTMRSRPRGQETEEQSFSKADEALRKRKWISFSPADPKRIWSCGYSSKSFIGITAWLAYRKCGSCRISFVRPVPRTQRLGGVTSRRGVLVVRSRTACPQPAGNASRSDRKPYGCHSLSSS